MNPSRKDRIARAFDGAADYEAHADVQRIVATRLADHILGLDLDPALPALEIGCGTGFLTKAMLDARPELRLIVSDIAPAMLDRARALIADRPNVSYALIDGEDLDIAPASLGLIASSLAFQWFENLQESVARMMGALAPGGWLAFSTLAAGSFREWTEAQRQAGLEGLTRDYPDYIIFAEIASGTCSVDVVRYSLSQPHTNAASFLRSLKAIGAHARWRDAAPSSAARLRHAMSLFERQGASISYEIAQVTIRREK
jgi:malonyl-CoA O-methyltransferase